MNVNELLDTIEDTLEESAGMPLSGGKRIVDVEQIRDYLDEIRQNLPVELRQAQSIVSDRAQLIESANAQAQAIVKKAEERARVLVSEAEIVKSVARFGCTVGKQTHIAGRTQESDALAAQATEAYGQTDSSALSLSIAMVLAAGVRKANIKSALRVSRDLN